ncbi:MAG: hypothetical protein WA602_18015 [Silvibacterium sp.]
MLLVFCLALSLMSLTHTTTTSTPMPTAAPNSSQSKELNSLNSDKSSLESQRIELEKRQDFWHATYLTLAMLAVALGILSWLSQRFESKNAHVERPLTTRISKIDDRIREIEKEVSDAALAEMQSAAAHIEHETEALKQRNLKTESALNAANVSLEQERLKRLDLEKSLAPRILPYREYTDGTTNVDDLKACGPTEVNIEFSRDAEAERAAYNLAFLFHKAGWNVVSAAPASKVLFDGIAVYGLESPEREKADLLHTNISETVQEWLLLNGWRAVMKAPGWGIGSIGVTKAPAQIFVEVGLKPNPYFEKDTVTDEVMIKVMEMYRNKAPNANPDKPIRNESLDVPGNNFLKLNMK